MGFFNEIKSALKEMWGEFGQSVEWQGKIYKCTVLEGQTSVELAEGGLIHDCEFSVKFLEDDLLGMRPRIGDNIVYNDITYQVENVSNYAKRGQLEVAVRAVR